MAVVSSDSILVLHVDDDQDFSDLTKRFVEREDGRMSVETASTVSDGLERLDQAEFDCVVSDLDMPRQNGLEFLEAVRQDSPDLPFILFTGKGSEEVASQAISDGVTDYLQKQSGTDQYALLANRIRNAVEATRFAQSAGQRQLRLDLALEATETGVWEWNIETDEVVWNETMERLLGIEPGTFDGTYEAHEEYLHPDDIPEVERAANEAIDGDGSFSAEFRMIREDGEHIWVRGLAKYFSEGGSERMLGTTTHITERKERERELEESKSKIETARAEKDRQSEAFHTFQDIVTDSTRTFDQQMHDVLSLGVDFLDLDIGIISKIDPPDYRVEHVVTPDGSIERGDVLDFSDTFCNVVYETNGPVAFRSPAEGGVEDHPCYQDLGLQAYLGEPLLVAGQRYGTLNFSSPNPREDSFTVGERALIRTITGWVTTKLSRHQLEEV